MEWSMKRTHPPEGCMKRTHPPEGNMERTHPPEGNMKRTHPPERNMKRTHPPEGKMKRTHPPGPEGLTKMLQGRVFFPTSEPPVVHGYHCSIFLVYYWDKYNCYRPSKTSQHSENCFHCICASILFLQPPQPIPSSPHYHQSSSETSCH